jgi:hypothetical protein
LHNHCRTAISGYITEHIICSHLGRTCHNPLILFVVLFPGWRRSAASWTISSSSW